MLINLEKWNNMTEAQFQTKFNRWCIYFWHTSDKFELKITDGKSIDFDRVVPHQVQGLLLKKMIYKLPDVGQDPKPVDSICLMGQGYVVIMFYTRGCKTFYMIKIQNWLFEKNTSQRKSITEDVAKKIGTTCKFA